MKYLYLITLIGGVLLHGNCQSEYELPKEVKRVLCLGNSITWSGEYVTYIDAYFTLHHPEKEIEFLNAGLPSETVSGLSEPGHADHRFPRPELQERLSRVLTATEPDLVLACYGMNDGIYLPFDEARFDQFKAGINWLHQQVTRSGVTIIHLTPPVYDERRGGAYANVLDIYADWLISRRYTAGWKVVDLHWPMKKYLEDRRLADPTFALAEDGIHPGAVGHWLMAKPVLLFLDQKEALEAESIEEALSPHPEGKKIFDLVARRQQIRRDAWLSHTGHKRPGLPEGLSLEEARRQMNLIDHQIDKLLEYSP